jgi:hypothetical protein
MLGEYEFFTYIKDFIEKLHIMVSSSKDQHVLLNHHVKNIKVLNINII